MEGFCFTIPFIDLYLPFLDLQDDTLNRLVTVEQVTTRETPSYKNRWLFDVLNYFLGTNGHFEVVLPKENATGLSMSSAESLERYQHMPCARNGAGFVPVKRANAISKHHAVSAWDQCPSQMCSISCWKIHRSSLFLITSQPQHVLGFAEPRVTPGCTVPSEAPSSWSGSHVPPLSMPGREARAHPRFMGAVGLEDVFAPKFGR